MGSPKYTESEQEIKMAEMNLGKLGKMFGSGDKSSKNIIGLICIILTLTLVISIFLESSNIKEIAGIISPILTLGIGYLVGSRGN